MSTAKKKVIAKKKVNPVAKVVKKKVAAVVKKVAVKKVVTKAPVKKKPVVAVKKTKGSNESIARTIIAKLLNYKNETKAKVIEAVKSKPATKGKVTAVKAAPKTASRAPIKFIKVYR